MCDLHIIKRNNIHSIHVAAKNNMQDWDEDLLNALTDSLVWDIVYGEPKAREAREIKRLEKEVSKIIKELKLQGREAQIAYLKENYLTVWGYCSEGKSIDDYQPEKPSWMLK